MNPETPQSEKDVKENLPNPTKSEQREQHDTFTAIKRVTAWVMIISATLFAFIGVLAIWEVFGENASDVIGRAFASLVVIAFAALVVNIASRVAEGKH